MEGEKVLSGYELRDWVKGTGLKRQKMAPNEKKTRN